MSDHDTESLRRALASSPGCKETRCKWETAMVRDGRAVWLMERGGYSDYEVTGAFTSLAEWERVKELRDKGVGSLPDGVLFMELDVPVDRPRGSFTASVRLSGDVVQEPIWAPSLNTESYAMIYQAGRSSDFLRVFVGFGDTKESALSSAMDLGNLCAAEGFGISGPVKDPSALYVAGSIFNDVTFRTDGIHSVSGIADASPIAFSSVDSIEDDIPEGYFQIRLPR